MCIHLDSVKSQVSSADALETQEVIASTSGMFYVLSECMAVHVQCYTIGSKKNQQLLTGVRQKLPDSPLPARTRSGHAAKRSATGMFCTIIIMVIYSLHCTCTCTSM